MNRNTSNFIENIGSRFFQHINRKESNPITFEDCCLLNPNQIQSLYSQFEVFNIIETYSMPILTNTRIKDTVEVNTYSLLSDYEPINIFNKVYHSFVENKPIYFEEIKMRNSKDKEKFCLIYLHGFSERSYENEIKHIFMPLISRLPNLEVLAVSLPYHMKRSPASQPYSGAYFFDSNPIVTIEAFRQAVHDVSQILSYAKERYNKVVVGGFSLGGHVTSFLGTCDKRADLYVMGQAGALLPETLKHLTICPGLSSKRKRWLEKGIDFEKLYNPIELLNYKSIISPKKVVSVGGVYDQLIQYHRVDKLRKLFDSQYNIDYSAGHIGFLFEFKKVMKQIVDIICMKAIEEDDDV